MKHPPFCPNKYCARHHGQGTHPPRWFVHNGFYTTRTFGVVPRFRCRTCGRGFSAQSFHLDYYGKIKLPYRYVFLQLTSGAGVRSIGRDLSVSHKTILNRIGRLSRQAIGIQALLGFSIVLQEDLVSDGFESFCGSQYFPNNVHLLLGKDSQFLYSFDYAHLKRKGRMTAKQKLRNRELQAKLQSDGISVSASFAQIVKSIEVLLKRGNRSPLTFYSDRKSEYAHQILRSQELMQRISQKAFHHVRISSRKPRTGTNPLFAVNYFDREIRKDCANHVRETVQYSRNVNNLLGRLAIYQLYHNYCKPYRIGKKEGERLLHAEVAGLSRQKIERELQSTFTRRRFLSHLPLSFSEAKTWLRGLLTPLSREGGYCPAYIWD